MTWMSLLDDLRMYGRFARDLPGFLRRRISLEDAHRIVVDQMAARERNFLRILERGVFGNPASPYRALMDMASCELGDLRGMIASDGLEATLLNLREAGVYVTFEEFKGREAIRRGSTELPVASHDFDNPFASRDYVTESGGTTGIGTRVSHDLEHIAARAPVRMLAMHAQGILEVPCAIWRGPLPAAAGINMMLSSALAGRMPERWFAPDLEGRKVALKYRVAQECIVRTARLHGVRIPRPEPIRLEEASRVARWAVAALERSGTCYVSCSASLAVRVCLAAEEEGGLDLTGTIFAAGGEPLTPAKERIIERTGARALPAYYFSEAGGVGFRCANPADSRDLHFVKDHLAMIQYPRRVPGTDIEVDAFNFTTLAPTAPKVLLNVEIDDYGVVDQRRCGCPLEELGFVEHFREIRSFRKLTGEGMTLIGSEMEQILQEVLPGRFGGSPLDYQLIEEEDERAMTRLSLIVGPRVEVDDEAEIIEAVLSELERGSPSASVAQGIWRQAGSLRVVRGEPVWTDRAKLMPLHLAARSGPS